MPWRYWPRVNRLKLDPFSAQLFAFRNRRATAVKVLYWERNGFCLWQKRLEKERFHWPRSSPEAVVMINVQVELALGRLRTVRFSGPVDRRSKRGTPI